MTGRSTWVRHEARYLDHAMFDPDRPAVRDDLLCVNPVAFWPRLIFTGPDPLQRARFPYHRGVVRILVSHPGPLDA